MTMQNHEIQQVLERGVTTLKRHGAIFENVRFEVSEEGISVKVRDPQQPYRIDLPDAVLLDFARLDFSGDDMVFDSADLPEDLAGLWQEIFAITLAPTRVERLRQTLSAFEGLPDAVVAKMKGLSLGAFLGEDAALADVALKKQLICARYIAKGGQTWLMPMLDFVNHSPTAGEFQVSADSVAITGNASDEVTVNYTFGDAFHYLALYHFPAQVRHAYSMAINLQFNGRPLRIERSYLDYDRHQAGAVSPKVVIKEDGTVVLSRLLLGQGSMPHTVIPAFKLAWEKAGLPHAEELFKALYRTNVAMFVELLRDLECVQGMAADWLRQATYQQLKLMAEH